MANKTTVLLDLGEAQPNAEWPDYLAYGFDESDVPDLLALVADEQLQDDHSDADQVWAPLHAWRTLGQLRSVEAVEPLLALFDRLFEDDWALEELPVVMGMIGEASVAPLVDYLYRLDHDEFARAMTADGLKQVAQHFPEARDRVVEALSGFLEQAREDSSMLNALVVGDLIDLDARESIDVVRELYVRGRADILHVGDIEDVEIAFGVRDERSTPRPDYFAQSVLARASARDDEDGLTQAGDDLYEMIEYSLSAYGTDESIVDVSELDGFLAALVCAPVLVNPSRWVPEIWGGESRAPEWEDMQEAHLFLSSVTLLYNDVVQQLSAGTYEPLFLQYTTEDRTYKFVDEWCAGFLRGLGLWPSLSRQERLLLEDELAPVRLFASEEKDESLDALGIDEIDEMQQRIKPAVEEIYRRFAAPAITRGETVRHAAPKVGRNDPCPCGSGKKYKKCCLH